MTINPIETLEYRDANRNGIEDREEGLYKPQDLILESNLPKDTSVKMPTFSPTEDNAVEMPRYSPTIKDFTDIIFDPFNPVDYASLGAGPGGKLAISANKARKLVERLATIKKQKKQAAGDYRRGQAELRENEPQGGTLMDKSRKKYNNLSIEEQKAARELLESKELDGFKKRVASYEMEQLKKFKFRNPKTQERYTLDEIDEIIMNRAAQRLSSEFEILRKGGNPAREVIRNYPDVVKIYLKSGREIPPVQGRPDQLVEYSKGLTRGIGRGRERGD